MTSQQHSNRTGRADSNRRPRRFSTQLLYGIACFFALFISATAVFAQTGGEGAIQGTVTDPTGAFVPGALVTATRLGELYVDGLPLTTISQQGDNRPVFSATCWLRRGLFASASRSSECHVPPGE